jgi:PAS domain S-box-containing protein
VDLQVALARLRTQVARRATERALRDSQERYALALAGTNDGVWDWRIATVEVFYSGRWKAIMGAADEVAPTVESWYARVHPDDLPRLQADLADYLTGTRETFEVEHRVRHDHDGFRWVVARGFAARDGDGRAVRMAGSVTDITEGKLADALTGLPNRLLFMDRLGRLVEHARRVPEFQFAVLFLDLDRFTTINDSLGHDAGDQLLVQTARRIEHTLRATDTVARFTTPSPAEDRPRVSGTTIARFGGDEFGVILGGIRHPSDATRVAERILHVLGSAFEVNGQEVFVGASVGIALSASGYARADDMVRDADTALSRAKSTGRARVEVFDAAMHDQVVARLQLETDLRYALERGELVVHYQPIVSLERSEIAGLEALVRWQHPGRGLVAPGEFIAVAEETGLIVPLGYAVMRSVCQQLAEWESKASAAARLSVGVNLSTRQLLIPDLPERLRQITGEFGVDPARIDLEITETSMMADPDRARDICLRLRAAGFRLSVDDFGTGYSSLSYLQRLPVDRIKIDRSFLAGAESPSDAEGIIRAIIGIATHLNLEVVAEGIETTAQLDQLLALRCGYGQGFLFSRPVAPDPLDRLLMQDLSVPVRPDPRLPRADA